MSHHTWLIFVDSKAARDIGQGGVLQSLISAAWQHWGPGHRTEILSMEIWAAVSTFDDCQALCGSISNCSMVFSDLMDH